MKTDTQESFKIDVESLYESIFSGNYIEEGCFLNPNWTAVLVPCGRTFEEHIFRALALSASQSGDSHVVITDVETLPPHQEAVMIPWDPNSFEEIRCSTLLGHVSCALFGQSAKWGALIEYEDYACIGGEQSFMQRFLAEAGGLGLLKQDFLQFAEKGWELESSQQQRILKKIGW